MSDMNYNKLVLEFRRQIYLCQSVGKGAMKNIIDQQYEYGLDKFECPYCVKQGSFLNGHSCEEMVNKE